MSINFPNADFTPQLVGYTGQGAFRFWCQKVLPIVYDDSLSYYELLNKVVAYLNNVIDDVSNVETNIQSLNDSYLALQNFVNENNVEISRILNEFDTYITNYFNNLDVQNEINNKLDSMASDGSLTSLIAPLVASTAPDLITSWLNDHITPTTPIVDDSLSVSGAAADSKVTGEKINSVTASADELLFRTGGRNVYLDSTSTSYVRATELTNPHTMPGDFLIVSPPMAKNTGFIELNEHDKFVYCNSMGRYFVAVIAFYDENREYLSDYTAPGVMGLTNMVYDAYYRPVPASAKYVVCSCYTEITGKAPDKFVCKIFSDSEVLDSLNLRQRVQTDPLTTDFFTKIRCSTSVSSNNLVVTSTSSTTMTFGIFFRREEYTDSDLHKIYVKIKFGGIDVANFSTFRLLTNYNGADRKLVEFSGNYEAIVDAPKHTAFSLLCVSSENLSITDNFTVSRYEYIDLSEMFGLGAEPDLGTFKKFFGENHKFNADPYKISPKFFGALISSLKKQSLILSDNLMLPTYDFATGASKQGIYATINPDLSVTFNGTALNTCYFTFIGASKEYKLPAGSYYFGGLETGSDSTYLLYGEFCDKPATEADAVILDNSKVHGAVDNLTISRDGYFRCNFTVYKGATLNNVVVKPFLSKNADYYSPPYFGANGLYNIAESCRQISIGSETSGKIKDIIRTIREPWVTLKEIRINPTAVGSAEPRIIPADTEMYGVSYAGMIQEGRDVFFNRNLNTFFSAVLNPASTMYQDPVCYGTYQGENYGAICGSFVDWMYGLNIYYGVGSFAEAGFKKYNYNGIRSIKIGDCAAWETADEAHVILIYDIIVDSYTFEPAYICTVEQARTTPPFVVKKRTVKAFEAMLASESVNWYLGRFEGHEIRDPEPIRFATDIIPDMGDQTYYYPNDDIMLYFPGGGSVLYYRESGDMSWNSVAISSLPSTTVNGERVYNVKNLLNGTKTFELTTNRLTNFPCRVTKIDPGYVTITVNGNTATAEVHPGSNNVTPIYGLIIVETSNHESEAHGTIWPHRPYSLSTNTYYISRPTNKHYEAVNNQFNFEIPNVEEGLGYYVRFYCETGYGECYVDSRYPWSY